jgi:hypothetical protein
MLSHAIQARINAGKPALTTVNTQPRNLQSILYTAKSTNFNDITSGNSGSYKAASGFDIATGLGSLQMTNLKATLLAI